MLISGTKTTMRWVIKNCWLTSKQKWGTCSFNAPPLDVTVAPLWAKSRLNTCSKSFFCGKKNSHSSCRVPSLWTDSEPESSAVNNRNVHQTLCKKCDIHWQNYEWNKKTNAGMFDKRKKETCSRLTWRNITCSNIPTLHSKFPACAPTLMPCSAESLYLFCHTLTELLHSQSRHLNVTGNNTNQAVNTNSNKTFLGTPRLLGTGIYHMNSL